MPHDTGGPVEPGAGAAGRRGGRVCGPRFAGFDRLATIEAGPSRWTAPAPHRALFAARPHLPTPTEGTVISPQVSRRALVQILSLPIWGAPIN